MADGPYTFRLVVGIDEDSRAFLVSQHLHASEAEAAARAKAEENIGRVFAVMQIEEAYVTSRPRAHKTYLLYPPKTADEPEQVEKLDV